MLLFVFVITLVAAATVHATEDDTEIRLQEASRISKDNFLWGPYRPSLYFGIRPRIPQSFLGGLMWARVDDVATVQERFRYTCEQSDGMQGYGWDEFDARSGGVQNIYDKDNGLDISISFVKIPGGAHGGSWAARIRGKVRPDSPADLNSTVIFHAALEGKESLVMGHQNDPLGFKGDVTILGESAGLDKYKIVFTQGIGQHPRFDHDSYESKPLDRTFVSSILAPEDMLWQSKVILYKELRTQIDEYIKKYGEENLPPPAQLFTIPQKAGTGNIHLIQKVFQGSFEFDVALESTSAGEEYSRDKISILIEKNSKNYWERFVKVFDFQPPFNVGEFQRFASSLFSNLLGGLGYFYGDSLVDRSYATEYNEENDGFWEETAAARARKLEKLEGPSELFTTVPSRPFFPRGFLWDEGFQLIPIIEWDFDLALEILESWFKLMDDEGWIGREQILGAEARSKVPIEFQVQYPHYANPPTFFLIIEILVSKLEAFNSTIEKTDPVKSYSVENSEYLQKPELAIQYLQEIYPKLRKHYNWYRKTQTGNIIDYDRESFSTKEAYRWRGRTKQHLLASGLDDYPRPQPPHPGELHVDLMSWMSMMTKSLGRISSLLGDQDGVEEFKNIDIAITRNLDDLHWSDKEKCYCDATIDDYEEHVLICHKGYVSITPFLTGMIDPMSDKLDHILTLLTDPEELWSPFGIRSLSKRSEFYGTEENYWRGPIWININYLILSQLLKYAQTDGPQQQRAKEIYGQLRLNLVRTVYNSWVETGFAWEQYNSETGKGQRTKHFTGWTSLTMKIMGMPDLTGGKWIPEESPGLDSHDEL
ncbi:putative mannosyl-oligosaccharide glucosidase [Golovinomyces cichoracearum]|uniref:Mannosyl-oligosaccharide glucosidase n=1 Tax=Golovinomyces cichoracearum TaxID=62708 RepID=A0A420ILY4_9PEZI|nr:putative mannosyl-oligosaccharide glucosidase [Golovinomyces cichoracearum]